MNHTIVPKFTFITHSLGCRTNQAELEVISNQLSVIGLTPLGSTNIQYLITNTKPDLILINTCMVTQKAERETRKAIRHFQKLYPKAKIIVLGCAVTAKEKLNITLPGADLLIGNEEKNVAIHKITAFIKNKMCYSRLSDRGLQCNTKKTEYEESGRKFIKIQDGCNNCCSFCITTLLRGEPRSEEPNNIIKGINEFQPKADLPQSGMDLWSKSQVETDSKIKEVILTGINIGLYGNDLNPPVSIWCLVGRILKETKIERLTLSTVYPEMLWYKGSDPVKGRTLLECIGNVRLTKSFHLALQSGSPTVLHRMNRPTDLKKLLEMINKIRKIQPDFTFRADVVAGFPRETEEEHQETLEFIRQAKISFVHVFPFSPRVGTVAYEMIRTKKWQDLPMEIKRRRATEIRLLVGKLSGELGREMIGKIYRTLVVREVDGGWEGITDNGLNVRIKNKELRIKGKMVQASISGYEKGQLLGDILSLPI